MPLLIATSQPEQRLDAAAASTAQILYLIAPQKLFVVFQTLPWSVLQQATEFYRPGKSTHLPLSVQCTRQTEQTSLYIKSHQHICRAHFSKHEAVLRAAVACVAAAGAPGTRQGRCNAESNLNLSEKFCFTSINFLLKHGVLQAELVPRALFDA
jgi:hypothetical protein